MIIAMGSNGLGLIPACRERSNQMYQKSTLLVALFAISSSFKFMHAQICTSSSASDFTHPIIVLSKLRCV